MNDGQWFRMKKYLQFLIIIIYFWSFSRTTTYSPQLLLGQTPEFTSPILSEYPRLLIHAGPHKTGTTSFQRKIFNLANELKEDGYIVPKDEFPGRFQKGIKVVANLAIAIQDDKSCIDHLGKIACATEFHEALEPGKQFTDSAWKNNNSVFLSSEEFDKPLNISKFKLLLPPSGKVEVILVYRTLGEWLRSLYSERLVQFNKNDVVSFVEWLRSIIIPNLPSYAHPLQVSEVVRRFLNMNITGVSIQILKYKGILNIETVIFCNLLKARHACQQSLLDDSMSKVMENVRIDSDLYLLLLEAEKRGVLEKNKTDIRSIAGSISVHQIETYYNPKKKFRDLSQDCLETHFLGMLKAHAKEEMLFVEGMSATSEEFRWKDDVLDDLSICTPNIIELFLEDEWVHILKVLDVQKIDNYSNKFV